MHWNYDNARGGSWWQQNIGTKMTAFWDGMKSGGSFNLLASHNVHEQEINKENRLVYIAGGATAMIGEMALIAFGGKKLVGTSPVWKEAGVATTAIGTLVPNAFGFSTGLGSTNSR